MGIPTKQALLRLTSVADGSPFVAVTSKPSLDTLALGFVSDGAPFIAALDTGTLIPKVGNPLGGGQTGGYIQLPGNPFGIISVRRWPDFKVFMFPESGGFGRWTVRWWLNIPGRPTGTIFDIQSGMSFVTGTVENGQLTVTVGDGTTTVQEFIDIPSGWTGVAVGYVPEDEEIRVTVGTNVITIPVNTLTVVGTPSELLFNFGPIKGGFAGITVSDQVIPYEVLLQLDELGPIGNPADILGGTEGQYIGPLQPTTPDPDTEIPRGMSINYGTQPDEPLYVIDGKFEWFEPTVADVILDSTQFVGIYQELLPPGPVWETDDDPKLRSLMEALSQETSRIHVQAGKIITEGNPLTTVELVPEWEVVFALPDTCAPPPLTLEGRQAAIAAAFLARGGQSVGYYLDLLSTIFGVNAVIEENWPALPFVTGDGTDESGSETGDALGTIADGLTWRISMLASEVGTQEMADRIECLINRTKPSHTRVVFNYTGDGVLYPAVTAVYATAGLGTVSGTTPIHAGAATFGIWLWVDAATSEDLILRVGSAFVRVTGVDADTFTVSLDNGYANPKLVRTNEWHWINLIYRNSVIELYVDDSLWSSWVGASLEGPFAGFSGLGTTVAKMMNLFGANRAFNWSERANLRFAGRHHDVRNATGMSWAGENVILQWIAPDSGGAVSNAGTGGTFPLAFGGDVTSEEV